MKSDYLHGKTIETVSEEILDAKAIIAIIGDD